MRGNETKNSHLFLIPVIAIAAASCQTPQQVSLRELLATPAAFDGKLIEVDACVVMGMERFGIRECGATPNFSPEICLDDYEHVLMTNRILGPDYRPPGIHEPKRNAKEERLYKRLMRTRTGTRFTAKLEGEFQNSAVDSFGPECYRRLIVHRVLALTPYPGKSVRPREADDINSPTPH